MSLLDKAKKFREHTSEQSAASGTDIVFDTSSGISEEDQKDIIAQIDKVAQQNRISAAPETLAVKAKKRGYFFPLIVNFGAFLLLVSGFFVLSAFFQQSESDLRTESTVIRSAEGRLIQEMKRETEVRIREKEQEISSIQSRLDEIDRERRDLQANMDSRVRQKEEELRKDLEAELAEERRKLTAQGLSEAVIVERLRQFETEKRAQFDAELAAFRRQVEAERTVMETNLQRLQGDFQRDLTALRSERAQIFEESRRREETLRAQLEERTRSLESSAAHNMEALTRAREELRRLEEEKDRAALVEGQILGFYGTAGSLIREGRLEEAKRTIEELKNFLGEPAIRDLPGIQERRAIDLAVAEALSGMIEENLRRQRETMSISQVLQTGTMLEEIRKTSLDAQAAQAAGDMPEAERLYTSALSRVPEVLASHEYFILKQRQEESARRVAMENAIGRAEAAFGAGNHQAAVTAYTQALAYMPLSGDDGLRISRNIQRSGYEILLSEQRQLDTRNSPELLSQGNRLLAEGRYQQAAASFITLIERFPRSAQAPEALTGIRRTVSAQNDILENRGTAASSTVASLERELQAARESHAAELGSQNTRLRNEYEARIANLEARIAELGRTQVTTDAAAAPPQVVEVVPAQTQEELRRLAAIEADYNRLKSLYRDYSLKEDGTLRARGEDGIVEAKLFLDGFLASESIRTTLPGLGDRIKRYDRAFESAGRNDALMEASDIAFRLASYETRAEKVTYLRTELARYSANPSMKEYLETLQEFSR